MNTNDRFREALESAVEDAIANVPQEVVTAVWNACDDERGRLLEENERLRAELDALKKRVRRLHHEVDGSPDSEGSCIEDGQDYPCATIRALDPAEPPHAPEVTA